MRKRSVVKIDKQEYTIKELTVKEIIEILSTTQFGDEEPKTQVESLFGFGNFIDKIINVGFEGGINREALIELAPSELNEIYLAFKDANSHFFVAAQYLKLGEVLQQMTQNFIKDFSS